MIELINENNINCSAEAFSSSWRFSHNGIVSNDTLDEHDPDYMKKVILREQSLGNLVYTYMSDGESYGIISFHPIKAHISKLYVNPAHIRQGIGRALVCFARDKMPEGCEITVYSLTRNARAIAFYKSLGFKDSDKRLDFPECSDSLAVFVYDNNSEL